jgi:hypothetical protein
MQNQNQLIIAKQKQHFILVKRYEQTQLQKSTQLIHHAITVIGCMPFYQSSGNNSEQENTWFPFRGFQEADDKNRGLFLKPALKNNKLNMEYYPKELVDNYLKSVKSQYSDERCNSITQLFARFGNFEAMSISMLIGGGYWDTNDGKNLIQYIDKEFKEPITALKNYWNEPIKQISH